MGLTIYKAHFFQNVKEICYCKWKWYKWYDYLCITLVLFRPDKRGLGFPNLPYSHLLNSGVDLRGCPWHAPPYFAEMGVLSIFAETRHLTGVPRHGSFSKKLFVPPIENTWICIWNLRGCNGFQSQFGQLHICIPTFPLSTPLDLYQFSQINGTHFCTRSWVTNFKHKNKFHIYRPTTVLKIIESVWEYVCIFVCMYGYVFRRALRYRAETWHGGRGQAHEVCGHIFEATPPGVKGHPGINLP